MKNLIYCYNHSNLSDQKFVWIQKDAQDSYRSSDRKKKVKKVRLRRIRKRILHETIFTKESKNHEIWLKRVKNPNTKPYVTLTYILTKSDKISYHRFFTECDCNVCQLLENGFVMFHDHLLQHLDVLEGGQPELGDPLHVLALIFLFFLLLFKFDLSWPKKLKWKHMHSIKNTKHLQLKSRQNAALTFIKN